MPPPWQSWTNARKEEAVAVAASEDESLDDKQAQQQGNDRRRLPNCSAEHETQATCQLQPGQEEHSDPDQLQAHWNA
jgi:hypothetical protein